MNYRIQYKKELNPSQLEAVNFTRGPLLVIAGAGSGKTRTLTYRVARLVEEGISPNSILLLTFTRKAAQEMLKRATELLDDRCQRVAGGTFHSFAYDVLRKYAYKLGFEHGFSIIDRMDSEDLISMMRKAMTGTAKSGSLPRKQTLANIFSRAVNKDLSLEDIVVNDYPQFIRHLEAIHEISKLYQRQKAEHHFMDYDDLLIYLEMLLKEHIDVRDNMCKTYQYLMVDEYQDTNKIQAEIIYLLAGTHENIMVVGDDSQSIYAFRGANFENIMRFPEIFPKTRTIQLEENYRSVEPILNLTNVIIERATWKYSKKLFTRKPGGVLPLLIKAQSENIQSRFVVEKIQNLLGSGVSLRQIAVLFRASFHSFDLEIELAREGIPFVKVGGFKFVESAHIKDVLAHLRVLFNPYDRISWYRILLLLDNIGPKTALDIYERIMAEKAGHTGFIKTKFKVGRSKGLDELKHLFSDIDAKPMSVAQMGEAIVKYYLPLLKKKYDDHPKRSRDLEHLVTIMERYHHLEPFLTDMALEPPNTSSNDTLLSHDPVDDRLVLSTVHSAKGLEWHTVFIIWVLDGRFPSIHAIHDEKDLEEELRLIYVAATRAKETLFFTYPAQIYDRTSGMVLNRPCRFIDNISEDILPKLNVSNGDLINPLYF
ncbi:MAG: ATP-dependent helicase [Deltaproteobacteria bacterium]|jgi:DNA helicase-2/ATP-dependent DNA helicase PcrA|nr:ATP-dependent helicase [Deltaproteobacteria bacterium]